MQLNNKLKLVTILPLLLLLGIAGYALLISLGKIPFAIDMSILLYASAGIIGLVFILALVGILASKELKYNTKNLEEILTNSLIDSDELYDEKGMNLNPNIDLKSKEGMKMPICSLKRLLKMRRQIKWKHLKPMLQSHSF